MGMDYHHSSYSSLNDPQFQSIKTAMQTQVPLLISDILKNGNSFFGISHLQLPENGIDSLSLRLYLTDFIIKTLPFQKEYFISCVFFVIDNEHYFPFTEEKKSNSIQTLYIVQCTFFYF